MSEPRTIERLAIESGRRYVAPCIAHSGSLYAQLPTLTKRYVDLLELWSRYQIYILTSHGKKSHFVESIPRRHRAGVVIAGKSVGPGGIVIRKYRMYSVYRRGMLSGIYVETRRKKSGLIGDIVVSVVEESVETVNESLAPSAALHQASHIVGNIE